MIDLITIIIVTFYTLQFLIATVNYLFAEKLSEEYTNESPLVSILVPARNEEKNIKNLITAIEEQNYANYELIIADDNSDDKTAEFIKAHASTNPKISLISIEKLPMGWLGKNLACHTLSQHASGDFLLFIDADVKLEHSVVSRALAYMSKRKLGLVSIFPMQEMAKSSEYLTIPIMNYILLSLLPLPLVRISRFKSLSAANGQFMLFDTKVYKSIEPHKAIKNNKVEDIAIARLLKQNKTKVACLANERQVKCNMYSGFSEAIQGFSKNIVAYFGNSFLLGFVFWILSTFGLLWLIVFLPNISWLIVLLSILITRLLISIQSNQNGMKNMLLHFPQQFMIGYLLLLSTIYKLRKQYQWKGRNIS